jgi:uncharacterized MAPEG superfamily protein
MTIAFWCVLAAAVMPYIFTGMAKFGQRDAQDAKPARYDNHAPRAYLSQLTGRKLRAHWAQLNAFEAFPAFAAAVIIAHIAGGNPTSIDGLAVLFVAFRLVYGYCYIADKPSTRSLVWLGGLLCVIGLFVVAAMGTGVA